MKFLSIVPVRECLSFSFSALVGEDSPLFDCGDPLDPLPRKSSSSSASETGGIPFVREFPDPGGDWLTKDDAELSAALDRRGGGIDARVRGPPPLAGGLAAPRVGER